MNINDFQSSQKKDYAELCPSCHGKTYLQRSGPHVKWSCYTCGYIKFLPQSWKQFVMPFGIYKGQLLVDLIKSNPAYCRWAADNIEIEKIRQKFIAALKESHD